MALTVTAQTAREEIRANKYLSGSQYLDYNRRLPDKPLTPAPKGYEPYYMSHYGRHGSRWLISDNSYTGPRDVLREAKEQGKLTPLGEETLKKIEEFEPTGTKGVYRITLSYPDRYPGVWYARRVGTLSAVVPGEDF